MAAAPRLPSWRQRNATWPPAPPCTAALRLSGTAMPALWDPCDLLLLCATSFSSSLKLTHLSMPCTYDAWMMCRLAAQQLGLLLLVAELQEGWQQAEAAWCSGGGVPPGAQDQEQSQTFGEAALAASHAVAAASVVDGDSGSSSSDSGAATAAGDVLAALAGAGDWLEALSGDDFPRQLSWSEGLCGLTLLPLR